MDSSSSLEPLGLVVAVQLEPEFVHSMTQVTKILQCITVMSTIYIKL